MFNANLSSISAILYRGVKPAVEVGGGGGIEQKCSILFDIVVISSMWSIYLAYVCIPENINFLLTV